MYDITQLQQSVTNSVSTNLTKQIMAWVLIPSIVLTVVILVLYIVHAVRRYRLEKALFEIRDLLRDMQKNQSTQAPVHTAAASMPNTPKDIEQTPETSDSKTP